MAFRKYNVTLEANVMKHDEKENLQVSGVRIVINSWCSQDTTEQLCEKISNLMSSEEEILGEDIIKKIEALLEEPEFSKIKATISEENLKESREMFMPKINIEESEENSISVKVDMGGMINVNQTTHLIKVKIRNRIFGL